MAALACATRLAALGGVILSGGGACTAGLTTRVGSYDGGSRVARLAALGGTAAVAALACSGRLAARGSGISAAAAPVYSARSAARLATTAALAMPASLRSTASQRRRRSCTLPASPPSAAWSATAAALAPPTSVRSTASSAAAALVRAAHLAALRGAIRNGGGVRAANLAGPGGICDGGARTACLAALSGV